MNSLLIKNGTLIDPASGKEGVMDLLIEKGKVSKVGANLKGGDSVIDAKGCIVAPGFIDLHTHLREPGYEYKETIATGTEAAVAGGFTSILCMANTKPVNDNASVTEYILDKARTEGHCHVFPVGAATKDLKGEELAEIGEMAAAGVVAISDDGRPIGNAHMIRKVMEYTKTFGLFLSTHAEEPDFAYGIVHEGQLATEMGLPGLPREAEEMAIYRDIELAALTGCHLHVAHISTARSVELIRQAKKRGLPVTCEVTPHHFTLTVDAIKGYNTNAKMRPPLRGPEDVKALLKGLADGTIDAIATDHAPHSLVEKEVDFISAANGIIGLETALPLSLALVEKKVLSLKRILELLTSGPARVASLKGKGTLAPGSDADVVIFDPKAPVTIDPAHFKSKSRNTPFSDWKLKGKVRYTLVSGRLAYEA